MKNALGWSVVVMGTALVLYPPATAGGSWPEAACVAVALACLVGALTTRRWIVMAGWGTALVILYVIAAQAGDGPPRLAAPLVGVAVYLLLELFDRFLAAVAAGPEMDPLGPRQLRTIARSALIGCASALVVLVAENLISTTGPLPLALAGLCALAAAAAVILLSTGEGQT